MIDQPFRAEPHLLRASGDTQVGLHARANAMTAARFGRRVFLRAVVEVSNFCRENCVYCGMRRDNRELSRFRAELDQLAELVVHQRPTSITDINIQTGEDPVAVREVILPLLKILRRETNLGISVCLGTLEPALYDQLYEAGARIYIMKFELADPVLYRQMLAPGTLHERLHHIRALQSRGWSVSSGFIAGLPGQSDADLLQNFELARELQLSGCSVSPFIPGESTPLAAAETGSIDLTLNCMAMLRLLEPGWIIPAVSALNISDPDSGYRRGLRTGANLVTINLTPSRIRNDYLLYKRDRFIMTEEKILAALEAERLAPSTQSLADYYRSRERGSKVRPLQRARALSELQS